MSSPTVFSGVVPFVAVAEEKSFRVAAQRLSVTVAAVSKAVSRLEEELGVTLVARTTRSVALTPAGVELLARFRSAIDLVEQARSAASLARSGPFGEISVSLSFVFASVVIRQFATLAARHPGVSFRFQLTDRLSKLIDEKIDVAVRIGALADSSQLARRVHLPRWVTIASPLYLSQRGRPGSLGELAAHNCLRFVTQTGKPRNWTFEQSGEDVEWPVAGNLLVDQGEVLVQAALDGTGIAQVLDFMVAEHVEQGRLVELFSEHASAAPPVHVVFARGRKRDPNIRLCVDFLTTLFSTLPRLPRAQGAGSSRLMPR